MNIPTDAPGGGRAGRPVEDCRTLDQVRAEIDRLDVEIVDLLARRARYVGRAADFKAIVEDVVVPSRIEAIVGKVRAEATKTGGDPALIETIYRAMIDAFIAFERSVWLTRHK